MPEGIGPHLPLPGALSPLCFWRTQGRPGGCWVAGLGLVGSQEQGTRLRKASGFSASSPPAPLISARRVLGDLKWLGRYEGYVREFQLQEAQVFNMDGKHCPLPLPCGLGGGSGAPTIHNHRARARKVTASLCGAAGIVRPVPGTSAASAHRDPVTW